MANLVSVGWMCHDYPELRFKNARLSEPPDICSVITVINDSEFMISNTLLVIAL
jgi:hypothetical protein